MFDYDKIIRDFNLDCQTSKNMLDAINLWTDVFNGTPPWLNNDVKTLNVAKTMCEKVAKAVTIELKTSCSDKYMDEVYQKVIRSIRRYTEFAIGKGNMFFKPVYENGKISVSVIHADKFIPFKFDSTSGELQGVIIVDQIVNGDKVYTRLEYNELIDNKLIIKNIAYEGTLSGTVLSRKIELSAVPKWSSIKSEQAIDGVDKIIGGFFNMNNSNTIDNASPLGISLFHNGLGTLEEIDKQFSRILWEYEGSELAIDIDSTMLDIDPKTGNTIYPKGKKRLYRKVLVDDDDTKNKWNIFSPEIRNSPLFDGLNELLRQLESQCGLAFGVLSKNSEIAKTATEIKTSKQEYYITVGDIQTSMQYALEDLMYGVYVLCRLYGIPVGLNYEMSFDWDDSILIDKEALQKQSMVELNADIIDRVQYLMETRDYSEDEAIEFIKKIDDRKNVAEPEQDPEEE